MSAVPTKPVPSSDLIARVTGEDSVEWFLASGRQSASEVEMVVSLSGTQLAEHRRILDFGCGCGRILLWLDEVGRSRELHGIDIDAEAVAWARENIPYATVTVNPHLPPLDFPDEYFDLVYNHSVFTHLDESYQDAWLAELRRVTRAGGAVVLTVSGEHPFETGLPAWRELGWDADALERTWREKGFVFIADDCWTGGPFPDFYHSAFHAPWYVFKHWSRYFTILAYLVRGSLDYQDFVLLQRN